jgi:hypothetical protein
MAGIISLNVVNMNFRVSLQKLSLAVAVWAVFLVLRAAKNGFVFV